MFFLLFLFEGFLIFFQQGQPETSIVVKQCRLNLLPDKETGKNYCFELDDSFTQVTLRFSVVDRDTFDEWVNLLVPLSNQDDIDDSDEDIAKLNSQMRNRSTSQKQVYPSIDELEEKQDDVESTFLPPKIENSE